MDKHLFYVQKIDMFNPAYITIIITTATPRCGGGN